MSKENRQLAKEFLLYWEKNSQEVGGKPPYFFDKLDIDRYLKEKFSSDKITLLKKLAKDMDSEKEGSQEYKDLNKKFVDLKQDLQRLHEIYIPLVSLMKTQGLISKRGSSYEVTTRGYDFMYESPWYKKQWFLTVMLAGLVSLISGVVNSYIDKRIWADKVQEIVIKNDEKVLKSEK